MLLVLAGCSGPTRNEPVAKLAGNVTINGKPLPSDAVGVVVFMPRAKGEAPAAEARLEDGRYKTDRSPRGEVTALFHIHRATGKTIKDSPTDAHPHPELIDLVPEKHRGGLKISVTGDNPHLDFDLRN